MNDKVEEPTEPTPYEREIARVATMTAAGQLKPEVRDRQEQQQSQFQSAAQVQHRARLLETDEEPQTLTPPSEYRAVEPGDA